MTKNAITTQTTSTSRPVIRIVAEYHMMGDMEGREWAELVLSEAKKEGLIHDYQVLGAYQGKWGLWLVLFTVDALVGEREGDARFHAGLSWEETKAAAEDLLNGPVIQDSDVQVRWISPTLVRD